MNLSSIINHQDKLSSELHWFHLLILLYKHFSYCLCRWLSTSIYHLTKPYIYYPHTAYIDQAFYRPRYGALTSRRNGYTNFNKNRRTMPSSLSRRYSSSSSSSADSSKPVGRGRQKQADPCCEICFGRGWHDELVQCNDCYGSGLNQAYPDLTCTVCDGRGDVNGPRLLCTCLY